MQRGSDKHGPELDEELQKETLSLEQGSPIEPRVDEYLEKEPAGQDQPVPDEIVATGGDRYGDQAEIEARSELARHLQPSAFPAGRDRLIESAREMNAPDHLVAMLRRLPDGETFENVQAVWETLGEQR